jgi:hypothetical protein
MLTRHDYYHFIRKYCTSCKNHSHCTSLSYYQSLNTGNGAQIKSHLAMIAYSRNDAHITSLLVIWYSFIETKSTQPTTVIYSLNYNVKFQIYVGLEYVFYLQNKQTGKRTKCSSYKIEFILRCCVIKTWLIHLDE